MFEPHNDPEESFPKLAEISIAFVDNGFVVRAVGRGLQKTYVVQASSNKPEEIEGVNDVIRTIYFNVVGDPHEPGRIQEGDHAIPDPDRSGPQ